MKKTANWNLYFRKQVSNPEMRRLIEEEIESLRVGTQIAGGSVKRGVARRIDPSALVLIIRACGSNTRFCAQVHYRGSNGLCDLLHES